MQEMPSPDWTTDLVDALEHPLRRSVLHILHEDDREMTVDQLANAVRRDAGPHRQPALHVELHHLHLPRLADAGLIAYDEDAGDVRPLDRLDRIAPSLEEYRTREGA